MSFARAALILLFLIAGLSNFATAAPYQAKTEFAPHVAWLQVIQENESRVRKVPVWLQQPDRFMILNTRRLNPKKSLTHVRLIDGSRVVNYDFAKWVRASNHQPDLKLYRKRVDLKPLSLNLQTRAQIRLISTWQEQGEALADKYSYVWGIWLREDKLAYELINEAWAGRYWVVYYAINQVSSHNHDDMAVGFLEKAPDKLLEQMANDAQGRRVLDSIYNELSMGYEWKDELRQSQRIIQARLLWAVENSLEGQIKKAITTKSPLKVFPVALPSVATIRVANIYAKRLGDGRIWVKLGSAACYFDKFKGQLQTLPKEVCTDPGIILPEDEIIKVYSFDDNEEMYTLPLALLRLDNNKWERYKVMGVEVAALAASGGYLAKAAQRGLLWAADFTMTSLWASTLVIEGYRGEILSRYGEKGRTFLHYTNYVQMATAFYGVGRASMLFGELFRSAEVVAAEMVVVTNNNQKLQDYVQSVIELVKKAEAAQLPRMQQVLGLTERQLANFLQMGRTSPQMIMRLLSDEGGEESEFLIFLRELQAKGIAGTKDLIKPILENARLLRREFMEQNTQKASEIFSRLMGYVREVQIARKTQQLGNTITALQKEINVVYKGQEIPTEIDHIAKSPTGQWIVAQVKAGNQGAFSNASRSWEGFIEQAEMTVLWAKQNLKGPVNFNYFVDKISPEAQKALTELGYKVILSKEYLER